MNERFCWNVTGGMIPSRIANIRAKNNTFFLFSIGFVGFVWTRDPRHRSNLILAIEEIIGLIVINI